MTAVRYWQGRRLDIDAAVVMPDHVHIIFRIIDGSALGAALQSIKGYSSRCLNILLRRKGAFRLSESFDHVIRNTKHLEEKMIYVRENPVTRGLVSDWRE
jgi:REP element-mobilizing transposase RayT